MEYQLGDLIYGLGVHLVHRASVEGFEVDFLVPRPGRPGLIVEADGDIHHMDEGRRRRRDEILERAGWSVLHIWGSEILNTPKEVRVRLEVELEGVPRARVARAEKKKAPKRMGGRRKWSGPSKIE